jgi:Tol biopolymer transport system component
MDSPNHKWTAYEASPDGNTLTAHASEHSQIGGYWDGNYFLSGSAVMFSSSAFTWVRSDGTTATGDPIENCEKHLDEGSGNYISGFSTYKQSSNGNVVIGGYCPNGDKWLFRADAEGTFQPLLNFPLQGISDINAMHLWAPPDFIWSSDDNYIAFNLFSLGKTEMYIVNVADSLNDPSIQPFHLNIGNGFLYYSPVWQPLAIPTVVEEKPTKTSTNTRLLAFTSAMENGNLDIYTMYPDGSGLTNLTNNPAHDTNPNFSPDGKRIAFQSDRDNGFTNLYVMNADGSELVQVTTNDQAMFNAHHEFSTNINPWSPDGSKLLFTEWSPDNETWQLVTIGADGQNRTTLAKGPSIYAFPSWSPDGQHVAFVQGYPPNGSQSSNTGHLYVVDASGNDLTDLTKALPAGEVLEGYFFSNFYWSLDGQSIFFIASNYNSIAQNGFGSESVVQPYWNVYESSLDGSLTLHVATRSPISGWWNGVYFITPIMGHGSFTWVYPDGSIHSINPTKYCEYQRLYDPGFESYASAVGNFRQSPNGNGVITASCPDGEIVVSWVNSTGTEFAPIARTSTAPSVGYLENAGWSQDDRFIAFILTADGRSDMYIVNIDEAIQDPSIQPVKIRIVGEGVKPDVAGGAQNSNISWQPIP